MDAYTKKFIEENDRIFVILEGICPTCGEILKIKSIGGTLRFIESWTVPVEIKPTEWYTREHYGDDGLDRALGGIEYVCPNNHTHYVEQNQFGDWN